MPIPVQNANASQALHEEFNLVGRYRPQLDEVIVPVVVVANVEGSGIPNPTRQAVSQGQNVADVAERSVFRFETPPGVFARITQLLIRNTAGDQFTTVFFGSTISAPATAASKTYIDGRRRAIGETPSCVLAHGTQIAALAQIHAILPSYRSTSGENLFNVDWLVGRTDAFDFVEMLGSALNATVDFTIFWEEFFITS